MAAIAPLQTGAKFLQLNSYPGAMCASPWCAGTVMHTGAAQSHDCARARGSTRWYLPWERTGLLTL